MASEWTTATVGDAFDLVTGYAFKSSDFIEHGVPVIKIKNVKAGEFNELEFSYASDSFLKERSDKLARYGDLLISMSGNRHDGSQETWVGKIAQFRKSGNYLINQRVGALRLKTNAQVDSRFASYLLSSLPYQELFIAIATSSGGQANLSPAQILGAPMRYPDLDSQHAIANILGMLDDKVELNRRMSETLEAMARALYHSWFVGFDPVKRKMEGRYTGLPNHLADLFPARLMDSDLGEIPEGWEARPLGDILEFAYGKALKAENRHDGTIPVYGSNGQIGWHNERIAAGPGIIIGRKGNPGVVTWASTGFFVIDTAFYIVPKPRWLGLHFLFHALRSHDLASLSGDSAVPGLNRNLAYMSMQLLPAKQVLDQFENVSRSLAERAYCFQEESRTLATLRDALLPKLISGELRVTQAERFTGRAV